MNWIDLKGKLKEFRSSVSNNHQVLGYQLSGADNEFQALFSQWIPSVVFNDKHVTFRLLEHSLWGKVVFRIPVFKMYDTGLAFYLDSTLVSGQMRKKVSGVYLRGIEIGCTTGVCVPTLCRDHPSLDWPYHYNFMLVVHYGRRQTPTCDALHHFPHLVSPQPSRILRPISRSSKWYGIFLVTICCHYGPM